MAHKPYLGAVTYRTNRTKKTPLGVLVRWYVGTPPRMEENFGTEKINLKNIFLF